MNTSPNQAPAAHDGTGMPQNMKIDDKAIKKMAGEAISNVDGVLSVEGSLTDLLKSSDDITKGIGVTLSEDGKSVQITTRIITEFGKNIPAIVSNVQAAVEKTLHDVAGLVAEKVDVEITDTMSRAEYEAKTAKASAPDAGH